MIKTERMRLAIAVLIVSFFIMLSADNKIERYLKLFCVLDDI